MSPELLELITKGGIAAILGFCWWQAEARCKDANARADKEREENRELAKEVVSTMVKTERTLATFEAIFTAGKKTGA
jgi:hypothetical protein